MVKINLRKLDRLLSARNIILIPFMLLSLYYGIIAADRYTSQATFTIMENGVASSGIDIGFLNLGNASNLEDERIIREYILSVDMLEFLESDMSLKSHYQGAMGDVISRLWANATKEEYYDYYLNHISVDFDEKSGLLLVEVQAFEREFAVAMLNAMLRKTESVVNDISQQLARAQSDFLELQLVSAQDALKNAKQKLLSFQNKYQVFSPELEGKSIAGILDQLDGSLTEEKAKLNQLLAYQKSDAPQVVASKERIRALTEQILSEKARLIGEGGGTINGLMSEYTNLRLELEFAEKAYSATLASLELAKAEASKKLKHLIVVSKPTLAEESKYPERSYISITALIMLTMLYGIVRMTITTILEHQD